MTQVEVFAAIRLRIISIVKDKPLRIAINGVEGSGKTTFAQLLTEYLINENNKAIHVSIDGFHHDRSYRYRQGRESARGYYEDSYDEKAFVEGVLTQSQNDSPCYTPASHDLHTDQYLNLSPIRITDDTIIITDGAYLFKPVYLPHWDLKIYLRADFETAMKRGALRDQEALGGYEAALRKFEQRYHAASKIYQQEVNPESHADIIVDNTDFENPELIK